MNVRVQPQLLTRLVSDLLVVPLTQGEQHNDSVQALDTVLTGRLREQITRSGFSGKEGETLLFPTRSLTVARVPKAQVPTPLLVQRNLPGKGAGVR